MDTKLIFCCVFVAFLCNPFVSSQKLTPREVTEIIFSSLEDSATENSNYVEGTTVSDELLEEVTEVNLEKYASLKEDILTGDGNEIREKEKNNKDETLTIVSISNEVLPDISNYSEFWERYQPPHAIAKAYPYYHAGFDEDYHPIWIEETGKWNIRKAVEAGGDTFKSFDRHCVQGIYRMGQSVRESLTDPEYSARGIIFIMDFQDFGFEQITHIPTLSYMINLMRKYLPLIQENLYLGMIVNTNAVAHTLLNIMRPVMGKVFEKVEIYGTNPKKFIPHILKRCPKDSIPEWYGGSKKFKPIKVYG